MVEYILYVLSDMLSAVAVGTAPRNSPSAPGPRNPFSVRKRDNKISQQLTLINSVSRPDGIVRELISGLVAWQRHARIVPGLVGLAK